MSVGIQSESVRAERKPMSENDRVSDLVEKAVNELGEHCDAVQIIAVVNNADGEDESVIVSYGVGGFHSRWAAVREVAMKWDEYVKEHARRSAIADVDEEEEE